MIEIYCSYCGQLIIETDDESEDAYYEIQADHRAQSAYCERKYREERALRAHRMLY